MYVSKPNQNIYSTHFVTYGVLSAKQLDNKHAPTFKYMCSK